MRSFSPAQCGHVFLPVHPASKTGGVRLTTFSIAKSRKPIKNCSTGPSLLFFGRKIKVAQGGIPAKLGMPIILWSRYAPVFEVEPEFAGLCFAANSAAGTYRHRKELTKNPGSKVRTRAVGYLGAIENGQRDFGFYLKKVCGHIHRKMLKSGASVISLVRKFRACVKRVCWTSPKYANRV